MNKAVALLAGGILLIIFGVSAAGSFSSDMSRFFTGAPTDKAIWMLIGGVVLSIGGVVGLLHYSMNCLSPLSEIIYVLGNTALVGRQKSF
jgi:hypothetical protein